MATRLYFLEDQRSHTVQSQDLQEICDLPLGSEPAPYLVIATANIQRVSSDQPGGMECEIRLDILSKFSVLLGSDHDGFLLNATTGIAQSLPNTVDFSRFDHATISKHISLMVTSTVPAEGDGGRDTRLPHSLREPPSVGPLLTPPPRAVLSARGGTPGQSGALLRNVRIVAFPADEVVAKYL
jgi:hypothetical protein